ncbi:MAG: DNA polymerase II [Lentisphaeria bacterium]|nr:DNA polymerase II [Lentisphaeria bacterium]
MNDLSALEELIPARLQRVVAAEIAEDGALELFQRSEDGATVTSQKTPYQPWLLTAGMELGQSLADTAALDHLEGPGAQKCRVRFDNWEKYDAALKQLKQLTGQTPSSPLAPYRVFSDDVQQALIDRQIRLFRGMEFHELRRMQLDIECRCSVPGKFCDAKVAADEIYMIALKDTAGFEHCFSTAECGGEANLLKTVLETIQQRDPDVIEGHNIFLFDLDYLEKRCKRHKIPFALGRGGRVAKSRPSRLTIAERIINFRRYDAYGRHIVDTWHLAMLADVSKRDLESYGLKYCAKYYGIAREGRVYIPGDQLTQRYDENPLEVAEYNLDDVRETDGLSRIISPSYFYQTQLLPIGYQNCILRGNATRIDAMLCAAYLNAGAALPSPQNAIPFEGALTAVGRTGAYRPAWHLDVRSLYPSILMMDHWSPASDHRGVFANLLENFRAFRLQAKDAARSAETQARRDEFQALQNSFKILINSFYGYLGFAQGTFNDFALAEKVTSTGRGILTQMRMHLEAAGAAILEMDTDGIYFVPPEGISPQQMREKIQQELPQGIEIELDGIFQAMFSYKSKNYALLEANNRISLHGAALRSRGLEPFQRRFIQEALEEILLKRSKDLTPLKERYLEELRNHAWPLTDFLRKENLTQTVESYQAALSSGKGKRSAVYELAARSQKELKPGDSVRYYVTGAKKSVQVVSNSKLEEEIDPLVRDENVAFYAEKLVSLADKFQEVLVS